MVLSVQFRPPKFFGPKNMLYKCFQQCCLSVQWFSSIISPCIYYLVVPTMGINNNNVRSQKPTGPRKKNPHLGWGNFQFNIIFSVTHYKDWNEPSSEVTIMRYRTLFQIVRYLFNLCPSYDFWGIIAFLWEHIFSHCGCRIFSIICIIYY